MKWLFSSIFGLTGLILLAAACPLLGSAGAVYYFAEYTTRDWAPATGTVTGLFESEGTDSSGFRNITYCPTVQFTPAGGQSIVVDVNECSSPPAYSVGDAVELTYNPASPENVRLKGGIADLFGSIGLYVLGILGGLSLVAGLVACGVALFFAARKQP